MYRNINKKIFHIVMVIVIIFAILCVGGIFILRYQVEGEANMPFKITKISLVESVEGTEKDNASEKWNFNVNQNNDIYIYIEKNSGYGKTEIIDSVEIKNIDINKEKKLGETKLYKPVTEEKRMFTNSQENEITEITYNGELESNKLSLYMPSTVLDSKLGYNNEYSCWIIVDKLINNDISIFKIKKLHHIDIIFL